MEPTAYPPDVLVRDHTVHRAVVGSRAYGLDRDGSDTDLRGVFQAPTPLYWLLDKPPTHVSGPDTPAVELFSWELERCCVLALSANPTVLECLWSPLIVTGTPTGEALLEVRDAFLSIRAASSYGAYGTARLEKMDAALRRGGRPDGKQAMHVLRLLRCGAHLLETGEVLVDVSDEREALLAVRDGVTPWPEVLARGERLRARLARAAERTRLPEHPDRERVDAFLAAARAESAARWTG